MLSEMRKKLGDEFDFEVVEMFGIKMLFSCGVRLDGGEYNISDILPDGLYMYAIRHTDGDYVFGEIADKVSVNFAGNILTNIEIKFESGEGIELMDEDYTFTDDDPYNYDDIEKYINTKNTEIEVIDKPYIECFRKNNY